MEAPKKRLLTSNIKSDVKFHVHCKYIGRLIGKNGQNIKALMEETNTVIRISRSDPADEQQICEIFGQENCIKAAKDKVLKQLAKFSQADYEAVVLDFPIPTQHVGRIIGAGGKNIKLIASETRSRIDFVKIPENEEQTICRITGKTKSAAISARYKIREKIAVLITRDEQKKLRTEALALGLKIAFQRTANPTMANSGKKSRKRRKICHYCENTYTGKLRRHFAESQKCKVLDKIPRLREQLQKYAVIKKLTPDQILSSNLREISSDILSSGRIQFKRPKSLKQKRSWIQSPDDPGTDECYICSHKSCRLYGIALHAPWKVKGHFKKEHPSQFSSKVNVEPKRPFKLTCEECSRDFQSRTAFAMHQRGSYAASCQKTLCVDPNIPIVKKATPIFRRAKQRYEYECKFCCTGLDTLSSSSYRKHLETEHGKYWCSFCDTTFSSRRELAIHPRYHHNEARCIFSRPMCKFCNATFSSTQRLKDHITNKRMECYNRVCKCINCIGTPVIPEIGIRRPNTSAVSFPKSKDFVGTPTLVVIIMNHEIRIGDPNLLEKMKVKFYPPTPAITARRTKPRPIREAKPLGREPGTENRSHGSNGNRSNNTDAKKNDIKAKPTGKTKKPKNSQKKNEKAKPKK